MEKCNKCNKIYTHKRRILAISGYCWRCGCLIKVAMKDCEPEEYNYPCGLEGFTLSEIEIAKIAGVNIKTKYSKFMDETYLANICEHCNALIGQHYLFTDYYSLAMCGDYKYEVIYQGLMCFECEGIL